MTFVENPESFRHTMCVAPAEGEGTLNIMTDLTCEAMSNPDKFPYGTGTFNSDRPRKLTYRKCISIKGYWMLMTETLIICLLHSILLKLSKC